jgi:predicted nucleic acid-binding protein
MYAVEFRARQYSLSFWDSIIVASALRSGCEVLYTEDMQDGPEIQDRLTVVNPFGIQRGNSG